MGVTITLLHNLRNRKIQQYCNGNSFVDFFDIDSEYWINIYSSFIKDKLSDYFSVSQQHKYAVIAGAVHPVTYELDHNTIKNVKECFENDYAAENLCGVYNSASDKTYETFNINNLTIKFCNELLRHDKILPICSLDGNIIDKHNSHILQCMLLNKFKNNEIADYYDVVDCMDTIIDNISINTIYNGFDVPLHMPHIVHKIYAFNTKGVNTDDRCIFSINAPDTDFKIILYRENGITLRDLFETVYALKCSKIDFWYELFCRLLLKYNYIANTKNNEQYKEFCNEIIEKCAYKYNTVYARNFFEMSDFEGNENINFMVLEFECDHGS